MWFAAQLREQCGANKKSVLRGFLILPAPGTGGALSSRPPDAASPAEHPLDASSPVTQAPGPGEVSEARTPALALGPWGVGPHRFPHQDASGLQAPLTAKHEDHQAKGGRW